ncbi:MAG: VOC family protein [Actinomycetota bacterium]|nr:VOC family protein [Actinomycetota bacterium]
MHQSRLCQLVIDVNDLDAGEAFWAAAVSGQAEPISKASNDIYRRLKLPHSELRLLLQLVPEPKSCKSRTHLDIEATDIEAEATRLEQLGATRVRHVAERGFQFWVLTDPFGNEFCVLQPEFPDLLANQPTRPTQATDIDATHDRHTEPRDQPPPTAW